MKKIIVGSALLFLAACGSEGTKSTDGNNTPPGGNSGGSNIISMDTMRMDTSSQSIKK